MRTHKKMLSVLVTLAMILSLIPTTALAAETGSGNVIEVSDTDELQAALDSCETNTTIQLKAGKEYGVVEVRPTASNETSMYCQTHDYGTDDAEAFAAHLEEPVYHCTPDYTTELKNVTIIGAEGATIAGFTASSGHTVGPAYDYVLDKDYPSGSVYYWTLNISNLTFKNVAFTGKIDINTSDEDSEYDGVTFDGCSFTTGGIVADNGPAIRYYNEANNGKSKNIVVKDCEFKNCYQGVYVHHVNGITVTDSVFDGTGHNAIAMQGHQGNVDLKDVVITGNTFKDINDRVIRFNNVGADSNITIQDNEATDSGDDDGQVMKATSIASGVTTSIGNNNWGDGKVVANDELKDEELVAQVGETKYTSLAAAVAAAEDGDTVILLGNVTLIETLTIDADKAIVLDLGDNTLTGHIDLKQGDLTIENGTVANPDSTTIDVRGSETDNGTSAKLTIADDATVTGGWGVVLNRTAGKQFTPAYNAQIDIYGTVTGTVSAAYVQGYVDSGDSVINVKNGAEMSAGSVAIAVNGAATVNVEEGAEIEGDTGIEVRKGTLNIAGGEVTGIGTPPDNDANNSGTTNVGAAVAVAPYDSEHAIDVNISAGTFTGTPAVVYNNPNGVVNPEYDIEIIGGTFNTDVSDYVAYGYKQGEDGKVVENTAEGVAKIEGSTTKYATLADAMEAAEEGDTITLLKDTISGEFIDVGGNCADDVTFDLNGYTLTLNPSGGSTGTTTNGFRVLKGYTATVENGKVVAAFNKDTNRVKVAFANYGTLTLDGVTVEHTGDLTGDAGSLVAYTINNGGKLDIIDSSITNTVTGAAADLGSWALVHGDYQYGNTGVITVDEDSVISGDISVEIVDKDSAAKLTFAGEMDGAFVEAGTVTEGENKFAQVEITGGKFYVRPADKYVAAGKVIVTENEGGTPVHYVGIHCDVTIDPDNGETPIETFYASGYMLEDLGQPPKAGYTCIGWSDGSQIVTFPYEITEDVTLTAQYEAIAVSSVSLDKSTLTLTAGDSATLVATVTPADALENTVTWTSSNTSVATVDENGKVTAVAAGTATITAAAGGKTAECAVTVNAKTSGGSTGGSSRPAGGGGSSSTTTTPTVPEAPKVDTSSPTVSTETKTDAATGSTTVTETKQDGTKVETTTNTDGSSTTTASKTETTTNKDGSTTTTTATNTTTQTATGDKVTEEKVEQKVENKDGSTTTTTTTETKSSETGLTVTEKKVEETKVDETTGEEVTTSTTETESSDGSKSTTTMDETGKVEAEVTVSSTAVNNAAKADEAVTLPMPAVEATKSTETAPTVSVSVPKNADSVKVEIPVVDVSAGTVVVAVDAEGNETVIPSTTLTENGVAVEVEGDVTLKVVDNSKDFHDVADGNTFADNIDYVSARGLFNGTTANTFSPNAETTRGQVMTVLARAAGADTSGAAIQKGMDWAKEQGISDGTNASGSVTRQQLATMLWRYAGEPKAEKALTGADAGSVSSYAEQALAWCIENGIMNGYGDGTLKPHTNASRAHVAAMVARFIQVIG